LCATFAAFVYFSIAVVVESVSASICSGWGDGSCAVAPFAIVARLVAHRACTFASPDGCWVIFLFVAGVFVVFRLAWGTGISFAVWVAIARCDFVVDFAIAIVVDTVAFFRFGRDLSGAFGPFSVLAGSQPLLTGAVWIVERAWWTCKTRLCQRIFASALVVDLSVAIVILSVASSVFFDFAEHVAHTWSPLVTLQAVLFSVLANALCALFCVGSTCTGSFFAGFA
jgi:hypothetical protein